MKIIFAGTPDFAAVALRALLNSEHQIVAVFTQPDRPAGRGRKFQPGAVKVLAEQFQLPIYQPVNLKNEADQTILKSLNADVMIVAAYGVILPKSVLDIPVYGCINIHASLLPRWRGAAPIQRAILADDSETGITIMQMAEGLDTGDILLTKKCRIEKTDTASLLHDKLADIGATAILEALTQLPDLKPVVQNEALACYACKLEKQEAHINWNEDAVSIVKKIRAFNGWPVAYTGHHGKPLRIWQADVETRHDASVSPGTVVAESKRGIMVQTGKDQICITELQMPGKKKIAVSDFVNGQSLLGELFD